MTRTENADVGVELQELDEVKLLVTKGQQTGVLTYAEVSTALTEVEFDESDVEDLHAYLEKAEIELVEEVDPALKRGARGARGRHQGPPPAEPKAHAST